MGVLPTVEELTERIARVEIGAFMARFEIADDILLAAWYLHGVASASDTSERYSLQCQRRAFAVGAHTSTWRWEAANALRGTGSRCASPLRSATAGPAWTQTRQRCTDGSEACWRPTPDPTAQVDTLALQAGVAFLGLDFGRLNPMLRSWRCQMSELARSVDLDALTGTTYGPAHAVITTVSSLLLYLSRGDREQLDIARGVLTGVLNLTAGSGTTTHDGSPRTC